MSDLLVASKVRKEFGGLVAVNDVDFTIPERAIVSLMGIGKAVAADVSEKHDDHPYGDPRD